MQRVEEIERSRAVICVVSCSANFTKWPFALSTLTLYRSSFSPCSLFFFILCLLVGSSRPCQEENRPRHAICESYSHAFTAFRRGKKKKVLHGHLDNRRKNYADNRRTR